MKRMIIAIAALVFASCAVGVSASVVLVMSTQAVHATAGPD
jgi:hypothetical protein